MNEYCNDIDILNGAYYMYQFTCTGVYTPVALFLYEPEVFDT